MRISDWSSDVCSSDLKTPASRPAITFKHVFPLSRASYNSPESTVAADLSPESKQHRRRCIPHYNDEKEKKRPTFPVALSRTRRTMIAVPARTMIEKARSDTCREGKEWVSECSTRGLPDT